MGMMKNPNPNMLLRIAQGDAFAMGFEYVKPTEHPELLAEMLKFERYVAHPTHLSVPAGTYTDDTQMSIAVAEALIEDPRPSGVAFAAHFFEAFKRDPRDGYSRGFQKLLEKSTDLQSLLNTIVPDSNKNGAAMRAVPLGVLPSPLMVMQIAEKQAVMTHNTPGGIQSAQAVALMSHLALHTDIHFADLPSWGDDQDCPIFKRFSEDWEGPVVGNSKDPNDLGVGINTAHAVCTLLRSDNSLVGIMKKLLEWGGDTDSVASIAWGIASTRYPNEILPEFFEHCLEPGRLYGPEFLKSLGVRLMERYADETNV